MPLPAGQTQPPPRLLIACLALALLLPGLAGHMPWKADDMLHLDAAWGMLESGDWLLPRPGGEAAATPPLYHWLAAALGALASPFMPAQDALRLASGVLSGAALFFIHAAARRLHGEGAGALLLLAGCLGFLLPAHEAQPQLAVLCGVAMLLYAVVRLPHAPWAGGLFFGLALAILALGDGLGALLPALAFTLALPFFGPGWRRPQALAALFLGLCAAALIVTPWLAFFAERAPALYHAWLREETSQLADAFRYDLPTFFDTFVWYAWPAWPIALWALWLRRREIASAELLLPLAATLIWMTATAAFAAPRGAGYIPLLPPLALLAAAGAGHLRRGAGSALDWFAMMTFTFVAILVWIGWSAIFLGWPAPLAKNMARIATVSAGSFSWFAAAIAALATIAWLAFIYATPRRQAHRGLLHWTAGLALVWFLGIALWSPWFDRAMSYEVLARGVARHKPAGACLAGRNLDDSDRAALHYLSGIAIAGERGRDGKPCNWMLASGSRAERAPAGWVKVWEGSRPSNRGTRYRLYRREG